MGHTQVSENISFQFRRLLGSVSEIIWQLCKEVMRRPCTERGMEALPVVTTGRPKNSHNGLIIYTILANASKNHDKTKLCHGEQFL